ncbi:MAG: RelA/SpoT domain-containing protein [Pseudomonadota bacterium]
MSFSTPKYSRSQVAKAGKALISTESSPNELLDAYEVLVNWRAAHSYPINTFQATLRNRLKNIEKKALVAQRLKRLPSIVGKLRRFPSMDLARMQDIGGLRAVMSSVQKVREIEILYKNENLRHALVSYKDYISSPKEDGYRGVHLVFKYKNPRAPEYDNLLLELQLRTKLQHAWATAVETMGTFLGQALKSGAGDQHWREFFSMAAAAFAQVEGTEPVPGFEDMARQRLFENLSRLESDLQVIRRLQGFSVAANHIHKEGVGGSYHLVILDSEDRSVTIRSYSFEALYQANKDYAEVEARVQSGEKLEAVLVSAGKLSQLKRAYPNYFLDTRDFVIEIRKVFSEARTANHSPQVQRP